MGGMRTGNRKAAAALVVLTPLVAELSLGSTPVRMAWLLLLWLPIYGAGVLLIRECVRRVGGGWPSLLLLGVAYELLEDGIGLQALTSPHLYGAAHEAPRVLGFNSVYWESNLVYHIVFSVFIPIMLTDLLFPSHRDRPYLKRTGLVITGVVAALGVGLVRVSVPPSQDPGYAVPLPLLAGYLVAVAVLAVLALRVLPRRPRPAPVPDAERLPAPRPWVAGLGGAAGTLAFILLTIPFGGARQPAFTHGAWAFLPMAVAAVVAVGMLLLIRHRVRTTAWTDQTTIGLITGALLAHTFAGVLVFGDDPVEQAGLELMAGMTLCLMLALGRRVRGRAAASLSRSSGSPTTP